MNKILSALFFLICFTIESSAQGVLKNYIDSALENNIVLKQKNISLQQAVYSLQSAKGMFYPRIGIQARYTTADGGRSIALPIGDMLNGVYTTLNDLTQTQKFPQLENQSINFLPQNFYDVKLHTEIPIINRQLSYNKKIKSQKVQLSQYELTIYKRELVEKIKTGYYKFLQTLDAIHIYQSALQLAKENKKSNESLLKNGKGLHAYVLRAESKIEAVKAKLTAAKQKSDNAKRYFNFLLNRNPQSAIRLLSPINNKVTTVLQKLNKEVDISKREELKELKKTIGIRENVLKMNKSVYYPTLNGFLDLGSQAEDLKFNSQSRYYMAGLQLKIPIFQGNRNQIKMKQSKLSLQNTRLQIQNTSHQLALSGNIAKNNLRTAYQNYLSSKKRMKATAAYQRLISKGYKSGTNTYLETLDAQNQLTQAKMAVSINKYKMLEAMAQLERATASYTFK